MAPLPRLIARRVANQLLTGMVATIRNAGKVELDVLVQKLGEQLAMLKQLDEMQESLIVVNRRKLKKRKLAKKEGEAAAEGEAAGADDEEVGDEEAGEEVEDDDVVLEPAE